LYECQCGHASGVRDECRNLGHNQGLGGTVKVTIVAAEADTWVSMGQEDEYAKRVAEFAGYQVDNKLVAHADLSAVFLRCLPRHQEEVADGLSRSGKPHVDRHGGLGRPAWSHLKQSLIRQPDIGNAVHYRVWLSNI
jgi:Aspartate/ornithine carbamoyltransferase, Asp/Orn binding domain